MSQPKIKVLFQLNELSFSGTTKAVLTFCRHLDRSRFEPFLFYKSTPKNLRYRRHQLEGLFSKKAKFRFQEHYQISQARLPEFKALMGDDHIQSGNWRDFVKFTEKIRPDIVHFSRGETSDWFTESINDLDPSIAIVETSIFGKSANADYTKRLDLVLMVSEWLKTQNPWANDKGKSFYLPILSPLHNQNLRKQFHVPDNMPIVGRISRPGLDNGEAVLQIFNQIKTPCYLFFLGGGLSLTDNAKLNDRVICLPPTTDDKMLSEFYNSLDVLLHYRKEGETYGMSIADAMMHGKPVVSHRSFLDNAQAELLLPQSSTPCGFVVAENDFADHAAKIDLLLTDLPLRNKMGELARERAQQFFASEVVTRKLETEYIRCLEKKSKSPA